jgi:hypothetical protein
MMEALTHTSAPNAGILSQDAQFLVYERICAGDSNNEIRAALAQAGFPSHITDSGLAYYRRQDVVKQARAEKLEVALQTGYALRSKRVELLEGMIATLKRTLEGRSEDEAVPRVPVRLSDRIALNAELKATVKMLGELVDEPAPSRVQVSGPGGAPIQSLNTYVPFQPNITSSLADALELFLVERGRISPGARPPEGWEPGDPIDREIEEAT